MKPLLIKAMKRGLDVSSVIQTHNNSEVAVVANDFHYPYQDNRVIRLWLKFLIDLNPDHIIINGDLIDCWELSKFDKDPRRGIRFKKEVEMAKDFFHNLRTLFPTTHIVYVYGNHEHRLQAYIIRGAPALIDFELASLEVLMELEKMDVEIAYSGLKESYYKFGALYISHFNKVSQHGGYTAKQLVDSKGVSIMHAHTHRMGSTYRTYISGEVLGGWDNGCMCNLHPQYILDPNWLHGFSLIYKEKSDNRFMVQQIPIIKYKFRYGNKLYQG